MPRHLVQITTSAVDKTLAAAAAARGMMATQKLIVFKHDSALGNAPSHKLFDLVQIERKRDVAVPRKFADYEVRIPAGDAFPSGVTVEVK